MSDIRIRLACGPYDRTSAIVHGLVKLPGANFTVFEMEDTARMFAGMFSGEYDASEMSLAELAHHTSRGDCDFIGIPVFPSRVFRHGFIFYNTLSRIEGPQDLDGKKIGFSSLVQTASVWIRGILFEEFAISPQRTSLYVASQRLSAEGVSQNGLETRDGSPVRALGKLGRNDAETVGLALQEGLVDVIGTTRIPRFFGKDERIKRLFENYRSAEVSYFEKTRIYPIMHVVVVRKSLVEKQPYLPAQLFELFSTAKKLAYAWRQNPSSVSIVWHGSYVEDEQQIFQNDPWAYGLEANAHVLDKFLSYCEDLGITERKIQPKDLFHPSTWSLEEKA